MNLLDNKIREKLAAIELIAFDVDGTLTDGGIVSSSDGVEIKRFDVKDGLGIAVARKHGIKIAFMSGRPSKVTTLRGKELGVEKIVMGYEDKGAVLKKISKELNVELSNTAFMGDDIVDLPAMRIAGLSIAVADAHSSVLSIADIITKRKGGLGAAREFIDEVLAAKGIEY